MLSQLKFKMKPILYYILYHITHPYIPTYLSLSLYSVIKMSFTVIVNLQKSMKKMKLLDLEEIYHTLNFCYQV